MRGPTMLFILLPRHPSPIISSIAEPQLLILITQVNQMVALISIIKLTNNSIN